MTVLTIMMGEFAASASVTEDDNFQVIASRLAYGHAGAVVVLSTEGQLAGLISDRDLVRAMSGSTKAPELKQARDIMRTDVVTCRPEQTELEVLRLMAEKGTRHMPVVIGKSVVGLITLDEVVKKHLVKIGHLSQKFGSRTQPTAVPHTRDEKKDEEAKTIAVAQALSMPEDDPRIGRLDLRAKRIFVEAGEAERSGTPALLRGFTKFHRLGSRPMVRRSVRQLEEAGLVTLDSPTTGTSARAKRIVLTEFGRALLNQMKSAAEGGAQTANT